MPKRTPASPTAWRSPGTEGKRGTMTPASAPSAAAASGAVRPLADGDLERMIAIDRAITGRSRRGFYEKRLAAMTKDAAAFAGLAFGEAADAQGFVLAHVLDGEFGGQFPVAMLDAIGVAPAARRRGIGHALLAALDRELARRGVRELRTEAPWSNAGLLRLFAAAGFTLAPRCILERSTAESEAR